MRIPMSFAVAGLLLAAGITSGSAGDRFGYGGAGYGYGAPYSAGYGYGSGFGDALVGGAYIGAPFTRTPRPSELVAPGLSYGTYGIPTAPGIRQAPAAQPVVYRIEGPTTRSGVRHRRGSQPGSEWTDPQDGEADAGSAGARVVTVPGR